MFVPVSTETYDMFDLDIPDIETAHYWGQSQQELDLENWHKQEFLRASKCPYCYDKLVRRWKRINIDDIHLKFIKVEVWYCQKCRYWQVGYSGYRDTQAGQWTEISAYISKLAQFPSALPSSIDAEFAQFIRRKPGYWQDIDPSQLEKLVASIFRMNYRDCEVIHVGGPCDGGVDVLFIDSTDERFLIQVKRRRRLNACEGVSTMRNIVGVLIDHDCLNGIVVTTADHFSYRAKAYAKRREKNGYSIKLVDRGKLDRMLDPILPDRPWLPVVEELNSIIGGRELSDHFTRSIPGSNPANSSWSQLPLFR